MQAVTVDGKDLQNKKLIKKRPYMKKGVKKVDFKLCLWYYRKAKIHTRTIPRPIVR